MEKYVDNTFMWEVPSIATRATKDNHQKVKILQEKAKKAKKAKK